MRGRHHLAAASTLLLGMAPVTACGRPIPDDQAGVAAPPGSDGGAADGAIPISDGASPADATGDDGSPDGPAPPCGLPGSDGRPLVFVTSETFSGAAPVSINQSGAPFFDARCGDLAHAAGFTGSFKAWVFSPGQAPNSSPAARIGISSVGWARRDGTLVFAGPTPSAPLLVPINVTEKCTTVSGGASVWTGAAAPDAVNDSCSDWNNAGLSGGVGSPGASDDNWQIAGTRACSEKHHLYCFQTSN